MEKAGGRIMTGREEKIPLLYTYCKHHQLEGEVKKLDNISQTGWNFSVCKNSNFWNDKMSGHTHRH